MTITALTSKQRAAIPEHVQRWIKVGLSTEPVNRRRAAKAVRACYKLAGLSAPQTEFAPSFEVTPSSRLNIRDSVRGAVRGAVWCVVWDAVDDAVWAALWDAVEKEVGATVGDAVWGRVRNAVGYPAVRAAVVSGQYDAHTCAFSSFCVDVLRIEMSADIRARLDAWCEVVQSCGGVYWGRDVVTVVDRPEAFERDSDGRITAVVYRDEWRVQV